MSHSARARAINVGLGVAIILSLSACTTGPGNKPSTLRWKTYSDDQAIAFPPASWTKGPFQYALTKVETTRRYTVIETESRGLRFHVSIQNTGAGEADVFAGMPKASLWLSDGAKIDKLVWTAAKVKIGPGEATTGMYFNDGSLSEGVRPVKLFIDGQPVAAW